MYGVKLTVPIGPLSANHKSLPLSFSFMTSNASLLGPSDLKQWYVRVSHTKSRIFGIEEQVEEFRI